MMPTTQEHRPDGSNPYRMDSEPPFTSRQQAWIHALVHCEVNGRLRRTKIVYLAAGVALSMLLRALSSEFFSAPPATVPPSPDSVDSTEEDYGPVRDDHPDACVVMDDAVCLLSREPCCAYVGSPPRDTPMDFSTPEFASPR